jgi:hypothetical protein
MFADGALRFGDRDFTDVEASGCLSRNRQHRSAGQKSG